MQLLSSPDVNWWTGVVWIIVMFLSAVWTLILTAPIHCRASIAETLIQRHISTNLMKKQTHLHFGERAHVQQIFTTPLRWLCDYLAIFWVVICHDHSFAKGQYHNPKLKRNIPHCSKGSWSTPSLRCIFFHHRFLHTPLDPCSDPPAVWPL